MRADGYHLIDAEMVSLDLADTLTFDEGDGLVVRGRSAGVRGRRRQPRRAGRCARSGARRTSPSTSASPPAPGSAAGPPTPPRCCAGPACSDLDVAAGLGADVPFCLVGGRARVTGIGERVEPLPFEPRTFTLLTPPVHCSTPAVYRAWDGLGGPTADGPNDLEPAALVVAPELAEWRDRLGDATGQTPVLAGSGSTWFVEGAHDGPDLVIVHATEPA